MKKIIILSACFSFLVSCGNGDKPSPEPIGNVYTITWKNDDGKILETDNNVPEGTMPSYDGTTPKKDSSDEFSYTFKGWTPEIVAVSSDATYTATYISTKNKYTVTFNSDGGTPIPSQEIEYDNKATKPDDPSKKPTAKFTYAFKEWRDSNNKRFDFSTPITANIVLKAFYTETINKYEVTWINESKTIDSQQLEYDSHPSHSDPSHSVVTGHTFTFNGWYDDKQVKLTNNYKISGETNFTAKWTDTINSHIVNWVNDNTPATVLETDSKVNYDSHPTYNGATPVSTKVKEGYHYTFAGWKDQDGKEYNANYKLPDKDITFTAQYTEEINKYTVIFVAGSNVTLSGTTSFTVNHGATYGSISNKPIATASTGFTLKEGFYIKNSQDLYEKISDSFVIKSAISVYALADINTYTVTFDLNGATGTAPASQTIEYNKKATKPTPDPTREKYNFDGWYEKEAGQLKPTAWDFSKDVVVSNVTLYAKWTYITFATDSWDNLISYAEEGLDKLHQVYQDDCDNNTDYPGTLIGLEKNLQITGGKIHKVRVIDEGHDILTSDTTKFASLTFEFSTLISSANDGAALKTSYSLRQDLTYDNTWSTSNLAASLNSVSNVVNNSLGGHLKEVAKATVDIPSSTCKWYRSLCFPLSVTEIGASDDHAYSGEGTVYKYYEGEESQVKLKRVKRDVAGNTPTWYWLRTPEVGTTNSAYYVYNGTPIVGDPGYVAAFLADMSLAVSCAFCI